MKRALISTWNKTGLKALSQSFQKLGIEIISTGGTAKELKKFGVKVVPVESVTNFPEMFSGRVKTLHPKIHGGILADKKNKKHLNELRKHDVKPIDLIIVNLYPFEEIIKSGETKLEKIIEFIDIGGPTMIRAAAKNFENVAVITNPDQYENVLKELKQKKGLSLETRKKLALEAFQRTAQYDSIISAYLANAFDSQKNANLLTLPFEKKTELRYGENPHQSGLFYTDPVFKETGISTSEQLHGKELSFNNINDANAGIELLKDLNEFKKPACVIIKHANPCGAAIALSLEKAFQKAFECDKESAFGSIIVLNKTCDLKTAQKISAFFNEVVIAPDFEKKALNLLKKKKNLRILKIPGLDKALPEKSFDLKRISSGLLLQESDSETLNQKTLKIVSQKKPSEQELQDLLFAWKIVKHTKSNAIVFAKNNSTVGIGAGQMSRIMSTKIAVERAQNRQKNAVMASDAFFPFRDNVELAAEHGISAIIQPGGSIKDKEIIKAADENNICLIFTGIRHFKH